MKYLKTYESILTAYELDIFASYKIGSLIKYGDHVYVVIGIDKDEKVLTGYVLCEFIYNITGIIKLDIYNSNTRNYFEFKEIDHLYNYVNWDEKSMRKISNEEVFFNFLTEKDLKKINEKVIEFNINFTDKYEKYKKQKSISKFKI